MIPALLLLALGACDAAPPAQNVVEDVAANDMIAEDVTEVRDDSARAEPDEADGRADVSSEAQANGDDSPSD